jgi:hypothetical protein
MALVINTELTTNTLRSPWKNGEEPTVLKATWENYEHWEGQKFVIRDEEDGKNDR